MYNSFKQFFSLFFLPVFLIGGVKPGIDTLFSPPYKAWIEGKRVAVLTNQTGISTTGKSTLSLFEEAEKRGELKLVCALSPEHGLWGYETAGSLVKNSTTPYGTPVFSLHGATRRPSQEILSTVDVIVFDIQDIGSRSYTYSSSLAYLMEEAAKAKKTVIVCDRPNPLGGTIVEGSLVEDQWRSFVSYLPTPYCHGMTIGEIARYYNTEASLNCSLLVAPLQGWKRSMRFDATGLAWIPTSPHIPTAQTAFFYPMTGILGELSIVNIGIGYTLPFQVIGAPWIDRHLLHQELINQRLPGITFLPFSYRPFFGLYKETLCHGVLLVIKHPSKLKPLTVAYTLLATLMKLYPSQMREKLKKKPEMFSKVLGTDKVRTWLLDTTSPLSMLQASLSTPDVQKFLQKRQEALIYK